MSGKVLLIDPIATNRISLGSILSAAHYQIHAVSGLGEVSSLLDDALFDAVIISLNSPLDLVKLKAMPALSNVPVIASQHAADDVARLALLHAGASDILTAPVARKVLLTGLRSLLRARNASAELQLREDTNRALGFHEAAPPFQSKSAAIVVCNDPKSCPGLLAKLQSIRNLSFSLRSDKQLFDPPQKQQSNSCFILCLTEKTARQALNILVEMRAHSATRHAAVIVAAPHSCADAAMDALDLGANDVLFDSYGTEEISFRIAAQIQHKKTNDRLRATLQAGLNAAVTDSLTGLYNRRYALTHLSHLFDKSLRSGTELSLIMVDLDHFKRVNDQFGHAAGDAVLCAVAKTLKGAIRASDLLARLGGEEFVVILPDTPPDQAQGLAQRLCGLVRNLRIKAAPRQITASIGLSAIGPDRLRTGPNPHFEHLLHEADKALYAAKSKGSDQVSYFTPQAA